MGKMDSAERAEMFAIIRGYVSQGECVKVHARSIERLQQLAQIAARLQCDIRFEAGDLMVLIPEKEEAA
jgi:hypothetical protein